MLKIEKITFEDLFSCIYKFFWVSASGKYCEKNLLSSRTVASVTNILLRKKCRSI